jgi:hypothetical protein
MEITEDITKKYSIYDRIFVFEISESSFDNAGILELNPTGRPRLIEFAIKLVKLNNCATTPSPTGPKKIAYSLLLIIDVPKFVIAANDNFDVTLRSFKIRVKV